MQATLCDVCGLPIRENAVELTHVRGRLVIMEDGRQRILQRDNGGSQRYVCVPCGTWIEQAIAHLHGSLHPSGGALSA
jgi:hypothetical protein